MVGLALVPCAALAALAWLPGRRFHKRRVCVELAVVLLLAAAVLRAAALLLAALLPAALPPAGCVNGRCQREADVCGCGCGCAVAGAGVAVVRFAGGVAGVVCWFCDWARLTASSAATALARVVFAVMTAKLTAWTCSGVGLQESAAAASCCCCSISWAVLGSGGGAAAANAGVAVVAFLPASVLAMPKSIVSRM